MLRKILRLYKKIKFFPLKHWELRKVLKHKGQLYIGGPTSLTANTILGRNPNFNGMKILGFGKYSPNAIAVNSLPGCPLVILLRISNLVIKGEKIIRTLNPAKIAPIICENIYPITFHIFKSLLKKSSVFFVLSEFHQE